MTLPVWPTIRDYTGPRAIATFPAVGKNWDTPNVALFAAVKAYIDDRARYQEEEVQAEITAFKTFAVGLQVNWQVDETSSIGALHQGPDLPEGDNFPFNQPAEIWQGGQPKFGKWRHYFNYEGKAWLLTYNMPFNPMNNSFGGRDSGDGRANIAAYMSFNCAGGDPGANRFSVGFAPGGLVDTVPDLTLGGRYEFYDGYPYGVISGSRAVAAEWRAPLASSAELRLIGNNGSPTPSPVAISAWGGAIPMLRIRTWDTYKENNQFQDADYRDLVTIRTDNARMTLKGPLQHMLREVTPSAGAAAINVDAGDDFTIYAIDSAAFTISNPTSSVQPNGQMIRIAIVNLSGGAIGTITWGSQYRLNGALSNPASLKVVNLLFRFGPSGNVYEICRSGSIDF